MQRDVVAVPGFWTVGETIDFLRRSHGLPDDFYDLFVVDPAHRPAGTVPTSRVLRNPRETRIRDIMDDRGLSVPATMDQEQVADIFRRNDLVTIPVVDDAQRLIGAITVDDIVDVIDEEAEEDMLGLARTGERDIFASPLRTARRRQSWLLITLVNTILASLVISRFEGAIGQIVALAILMPIVAAMGGNAGMQVVTVMVRALAARDLTGGGTWRVVGKEIVVGLMNGVVFATVMGTIATLWFGDPSLGAVLASAMMFNMVWAGLAGTLIPLTLNRFGVDPAVGAGPFLTTTTDVLGFFVFLGLASVFSPLEPAYAAGKSAYADFRLVRKSADLGLESGKRFSSVSSERRTEPAASPLRSSRAGHFLDGSLAGGGARAAPPTARLISSGGGILLLDRRRDRSADLADLVRSPERCRGFPRRGSGS